MIYYFFICLLFNRTKCMRKLCDACRLPLAVKFTPTWEKEVNFNVMCSVKRKLMPLSLNVKAEGYSMNCFVTCEDPSGEKTEFSSTVRNHINFGRVRTTSLQLVCSTLKYNWNSIGGFHIYSAIILLKRPYSNLFHVFTSRKQKLTCLAHLKIGRVTVFIYTYYVVIEDRVLRLMLNEPESANFLGALSSVYWQQHIPDRISLIMQCGSFPL